MKWHLLFLVSLLVLPCLNYGCRPTSTTETQESTAFPPNAELTRDSTGDLVGVQLVGKSNLERLEVTPTAIATIAQNDTVTSLSLQNTSVNDDALKPLANLKNLQLIDLAYTDATGDCLAMLSTLPNLVSIRLEGCDVSNDQLAPLKGMPQLVDLYLGKTSVSDEGLTHIKGLKKLVLLDLSDCDVSDDGLSSLGILPSIRRLWLSKTVRHGKNDRSKLTDASVAYLGTLKGLVELQIADSQITDDGLRRLKESLPNTKINTERTGVTHNEKQ